MTKSIIGLLFLVGILISVGFAITVPEGIVTLDGKIDFINEGWNDATYNGLYNATGSELGGALFLENSERVCVGFTVADATPLAEDYFQVTFTGGPDVQINRFSSRTKDYDWYWSAERCYSFSALGISKGSATQLTVKVKHDDFHHSAADLTQKTITLEPATRWGCLSYATECCIDTDCGAGKYCIPQGSCLMLGDCIGDYNCAVGEQCGTDWNCEPKPGYCTTNANCADDEYCMLAATPANNHCTDVTAGECGYIANHQWNEYECCADSDCIGIESCSNHACVVTNTCASNADCADTAYCTPTASGDKCLAITTGDCGYIEDHAWYNYECCDNGDCEAGQYCSGHTCIVNTSCQYECCSNSQCADDKYCNENKCEFVPEGDCGKVSEHAWHSYECCDDEDCDDSDLECSDNECVEKIECGGKINLKLSLLTTGKVKATVSGIDNCNGKTTSIREVDCSGNIVCSFSSGDTGGYCTFYPPATTGTYYYYACADLDNDGKKEFDSEGFMVTANCTSTGCMPSTWNACECTEGESAGTKSGTCTDNCGSTLEYSEECTCELPVKSTKQIQAENEIKDAENKIKDAKKEDLDTEKAENKLEQAQTALDAGQYELAKELAEEAQELVPEKVEEVEKDWIAENSEMIMYGVIGLAVAIIVFFILRHLTQGSGGTKPTPPESTVQ